MKGPSFVLAMTLAILPLQEGWAQRLSAESPISSMGVVRTICPSALGGCMAPFVLQARSPDHRWTGVAIGAGVLGLTGAILRASACGRDDSATRDSCVGPTLLWGLMGATVGAVIGGFIGSAIAK